MSDTDIRACPFCLRAHRPPALGMNSLADGGDPPCTCGFTACLSCCWHGSENRERARALLAEAHDAPPAVEIAKEILRRQREAIDDRIIAFRHADGISIETDDFDKMLIIRVESADGRPVRITDIASDEEGLVVTVDFTEPTVSVEFE